MLRIRRLVAATAIVLATLAAPALTTSSVAASPAAAPAAVTTVAPAAAPAVLPAVVPHTFTDPIRHDPHWITSYYGWRGSYFHRGVDISGYHFYGAYVYAATSGRVIVSHWDTTGWGYDMRILGWDGHMYRYSHLSYRYYGVGAYVYTGTHIANAGSTGWSTGPHLDFGTYWTTNYTSSVNPVTFMSARGVNITR